MNDKLTKAIELLAEANTLVQEVFPAGDELYNLHCAIEDVISTIEDMAGEIENG
jgi:hypothetical protein